MNAAERETMMELAERCKQAEVRSTAMHGLLSEVLELYPHLNCVCGRNKPRIGEDLRAHIKGALVKDGY